LGNSISFPIKKGIAQLGVWQGIYLCEFGIKPEEDQL
jgi:thiamine phosphate synthase YjbQ (UPF0047 family)